MARLSDTELKERLQGHYEYDQIPERKRPFAERMTFEELALGYDEDTVRAEADRCMQCQDPPCVVACPAHLNVPGYVKRIAEGDDKGALQMIVDTYPLPASCGRVCFHPCTDVCLRGVQGEPLNIPRLRRFVADKVSQYDLDYDIPESTGKRIACIGSGPASLSCAYHLRRRGHDVVVFERDHKPGGALNTIPNYRLPNDVLQDEIDVLRWLGVEIRTDEGVGGDGCIDELLNGYDAVFIGAGAVSSWKPGMPGIDLPGSITGLDFLRAADRGEQPCFNRVAVVGGGDVAMDALRTSLRTAETVHWVYRRSAEEMPSTEDEVVELGEEVVLHDLDEIEAAFVHPYKDNVLHEAREKLLHLTFERRQEIEAEINKGIKSRAVEAINRDADKSDGKLVVQLLTNPTQLFGENHVHGMELQRMELGPPDDSGRRKPQPVEGSEFIVNVDAVIWCIGQDVDSSWLPEDSGVELKKWGEVIADETQRTSRKRVFAGGDAVRGPSSMIDALADGIRAADEIHTEITAEVPA